MSAIRNQGELASPYFLLELWVRREEIDLDPETYATLKRKARALVRDARAFESRGEVPDEDWRARRLDLLGLTDATPLDGSAQPALRLATWGESKEQDAVVIADLAGDVDPDSRADEDLDPPSTAFELYLDDHQGEADWGLLLTGLEVRVYRKSAGISQQYLALDLDTLVEIDDEANWRAFAGIFRSSAFAPGEDGVPLIRRVVDESRRHASALAEDMRADVVDAAEAIIQGALDHPDNRDVIGDPTRAVLQILFEETLYYLYRILFVLYAEARDVLPISAAGPYATTYSLDHLVELARNEPDIRTGTYHDAALRRLFGMLWESPESAASALGIDPVGGELFDPERTPILNRCGIDDRFWRRALTSVALGAPDSPRRRLGRRSSFAELGVDQLGSIYEGLLVLEPYLAPGRRALVRIDKDRRVVTPEDVDGFTVLRELGEGDFVLESASGRRKGSGSFYTPAEITEYLARAAIEPLVDPILADAGEDPKEAERRILELKVCDPAMGSGAFLIQAARVLALAVARARAAGGDGRVTPDMVDRAKRSVVRRCLYGVDLNPLAVALAKVSVWLETLEPGQPLTFLDAHLRTGDSLVGVEFRGTGGRLTTKQLTVWPKDAVKGLQTYLKNEVVKITRNGEEPKAPDDHIVDLGRTVHERLGKRKARTGKKRMAGEASLPGIAATDLEDALNRMADERHALVEIPPDQDSLQLELELAERFHELESAEDSVWNRLRAAADFWCAQWFWTGEDAQHDDKGPVVPPGEAQFDQIMACLLTGDPVSDKLRPVLEESRAIARRRHFFHWALEFPEVMLEQGGFDAVIGNPPWNEINPDMDEFFSTYDPQSFGRRVDRRIKDRRKQELREDPGIDHFWRREARYLHELALYCKPESNHFMWYATEGNLRKGDTNVFRMFVERAHDLLRIGGFFAQVLPESFYISSPATGLRQQLLTRSRLDRFWVFQNTHRIFPIGTNIKICLLVAERGGGPTDSFRAAFKVGKDASGKTKAIRLEDLPSVLVDLDAAAPTIKVGQLSLLSPDTWSFPELQTALDAEIAALAAQVGDLEANWELRFCRELDAQGEVWGYADRSELTKLGASDDHYRWVGRDGELWIPVVGGEHIYELEFPAPNKDFKLWLRQSEFSRVPSRRNEDGTSVDGHYRVGWRKIGRSTDERSVIAAVLPPGVAAKNTCLTVWGGHLDDSETVVLASLMSSFCFDFLHRLRGTINLTYGVIRSVPAPPVGLLAGLERHGMNVLAATSGYSDLRAQRLCQHEWEIAEERASIDTKVALAYGLTLEQMTGVLSTFPDVDRVQPMLPTEPKSFVTRDLALLTYCELTDREPADISKLLREIGVDLPDPLPEYRRLDARVEAYKELGAVPYRPTPRGGRPPTDPALIEAVVEALSTDATTAADLSEMINEDEDAVAKVLKQLAKDDQAYAEGRGKNRRYYVIED